MISVILVIGFLRTVMVLLIIFYAVRLITRYVVPLLLQKTMKDMQSRMQQQMREQQRQAKRDGEVTIEKNPHQNNRHAPTGEYIDFEEVD